MIKRTAVVCVLAMTGCGGGTGQASPSASGQATLAPAPAPAPSGSNYDQTVLQDRPVAYWALNGASSTEADLSGHSNPGSYRGGTPASATMPNGDPVVVFNGTNQYLTVPSNRAFSISTTGNLTWEAWIAPSTLQFPGSAGSDGDYVDYMGKCDSYSPTCEWEARMYNTVNSQGRCNRLSAYAFNPSAGLGSGADWQPACGLFQAGQWLHVVGEYSTNSTPAACNSSQPGFLRIWVNGIPWNMEAHAPTGCMSQYKVVPKSNASPLNIGTMALDTWFQGAIGKVAIYDYLLTDAQIRNHYTAMTSRQPTGSCGDICGF